MTPSRDLESVRDHIHTLMNLYEHHLDLFWKWITLYVSIASALVLYVFNKDLSLSTRRLFPVVFAVVSMGVSFGCLIMWFWLRELETEVRQLSKEIDAIGYPSFLGIRMTLAAMIVSLLFAACSLLYAGFGSFG